MCLVTILYAYTMYLNPSWVIQRVISPLYWKKKFRTVYVKLFCFHYTKFLTAYDPTITGLFCFLVLYAHSFTEVLYQICVTDRSTHYQLYVLHTRQKEMGWMVRVARSHWILIDTYSGVKRSVFRGKKWFQK
jgi:hypothetical protein